MESCHHFDHWSSSPLDENIVGVHEIISVHSARLLAGVAAPADINRDITRDPSASTDPDRYAYASKARR